MRILLVGINYAPDLIGVPKYNTELCETLAAAGHEVHVVTAPPYYPGWNIPQAYRSRIYRSDIINNVSVTPRTDLCSEGAVRRQTADPSSFLCANQCRASYFGGDALAA